MRQGSLLGRQIVTRERASYSETHPVLPGFEGYVCTFECLTNCPLEPGQGCYWDDPDPSLFDQIVTERPQAQEESREGKRVTNSEGGDSK